MPSKRAPPHAMDDAHAAAATPRSRKRSSRPKSRSRSRDRRRSSPNPNPSARGSAGPSRKSVRRPKPRPFPDSATLATAIAAASAAAAPSPPARGSGGGGASRRGGGLWSDADEVALLAGAAAFKDRAGFAPRLPDMAGLYESLRGSISPHLDQAKVYYKLKRLKSKFQHTAPGDSSTPHDRRVRDLCAALWGGELARPVANHHVEAEVEDEEDDDDGGYAAAGVMEGAVRLPIVREVLEEYWKLNGQAMSGVSLEKGLGMLGSQEASASEVKWRRQLEADMRMQMRRHDLEKEVYGLLIDAIKGLGP